MSRGEAQAKEPEKSKGWKRVLNLASLVKREKPPVGTSMIDWRMVMGSTRMVRRGAE